MLPALRTHLELILLSDVIGVQREDVLGYVKLLGSGIGAVGAGVGSLACVYANVALQQAGPPEHLPTKAAALTHASSHLTL